MIKRMSLLEIINLFTFWIFIFTHVSYSASDENSSMHRYMTQDDDTIISNNQRFQQIMQGGGGSGVGINGGSGTVATDRRWKEPKLKIDKIDVKTELENLNISYIHQTKWPDQNKKLGPVTAVSFDKSGNVVIFHRVDRIWTQGTFDLMNNYRERNRGPIQDNTVIAFERKSGKVAYEWGKNLFYMPHGLTIDYEDNVWITDVALHQVMKFGPHGSSNKPLMTLGTQFVPGKSSNKFCKPTAVAVLKNGDFFVADGYCNARIVKFSKSGELILEWGQNSFQGDAYEVAPKNFFAVPHALTLANEKDLICAADRENGRVQCFYTTNGTFHSQYHNEIVGDRLFSVDYAPLQGGQLFVVNGPVSDFGDRKDHYNEVRGYVIDMKTKQVLSKFGPNDMEFSNPHDIAVTTDGNEIYVAELDPYRIHKFVSKRIVKGVSLSSSSSSLSSSKSSGVGIKPTTIIGDTISNSIVNDTRGSGINAIKGSIPANTTTTMTATTKSQSSSTALLIVSSIVVFSLLGFGLALLISRRRKRGCFPFGVRNRRHAWDFPTVKSDGFKLGNLLDHRKRGFEKLDQNASDEEPDATTNMLSSAQFA